MPVERVAGRRDHVVRTAARLMARDGFHATSMQALAREAGVSVGSVYQYLDNKSDLLLAVLTSGLEEFGRVLPAAIAAYDDPVRRLAAGFDAYCRVLHRNRDVAVLAYRETKTLPRPGRELVQQMEVETTRPLVDAIEQGQAAAIFDPDLPAAVVAHDLVVLAQGWALKHWYFSRVVDIDGYIATQLALVLRGLVEPRHRRRYRDLMEAPLPRPDGRESS